METDFEILEEYFDINLSSVYNLSIQVCPDGFAFLIHDLSRNRDVFFKSKSIPDLPEEHSDYFLCQYLNDYFESEELLQRSYRRVEIIFHTLNASLVPADLYLSEKSDELFKINFPNLRHYNLLSNKFQSIDAVLLYSIPDCLQAVVNKFYRNYKFYHPGIIFVNKAMKINRGNEGSAYFMSYFSGILHLLLIKGQELVFYNQVFCENQDEVLYYLFNLADEYKTVAPLSRLYLSGKISELPDIISAGSKYFNSVKYFPVQAELFKNSKASDELIHNFSLLFNLIECE